MRKLIISLLFLSLFGCNEKVDGTFYISNDSEDQAKIPVRVIVDEDTIFNEVAKFSQVRPDLQNIEKVKLTKGNHWVKIEISDTDISNKERINFDENKWIFLSYYFKKPADSAKVSDLKKTFGEKSQADSTLEQLYKGRKAGVSIHIMDKEPIHH